MGFPLTRPAARHAPIDGHVADGQHTAVLFPSSIVRWALYLFVASIPFEAPDRSIPIEIPTLTAAVFLLMTLLDLRVCYSRVPRALPWFAGWLWVFAAAALIGSSEHSGQVVHLFVLLVELLLVFWSVSNLIRDPGVLTETLSVFALACGLRAGLQMAGIGATAHTVWTGGERVTIFGQNANLSALILSVGLLAALGLYRSRASRWFRSRLFVWPLLLLIGAAIVHSGSRGGLLALAAGLAVFLFRGRTLWLRVRGAVAVVLAIGAVVWASFASDMVRKRFEDVTLNRSLAGREAIYPALLGMIVERPFLGWGPINNQYQLAARIGEPVRPSRDAHNLLLELLTTTGLAGTVPFLVGLALCAGAAWRARRGPPGTLSLSMLAVMFIGTMSGTWIASKILWLVFALSVTENPKDRSVPEPLRVNRRRRTATPMAHDHR